MPIERRSRFHGVCVSFALKKRSGGFDIKSKPPLKLRRNKVGDCCCALSGKTA
ncbi:hypothetical protein OBV_03150 [Oscillibacter valericigenes Sjm18-20]|nr:hypothetical protein OBV_03150 [Oscillibacter valericigenes Sjm18-20]